MQNPPLILASASPRRVELLSQLPVIPDRIVATDIDETPQKNELAHALAERLARAKAGHIASQFPEGFIIAADTVVSCGRRILPKATNDKEVAYCLELLSGRRHRVTTAVCVIKPALMQSPSVTCCRVVVSSVKFKRLSTHEIEHYCKHGEGIGKAGGYAVQGSAAGLISWIEGSYSNIVGLPLYETRNLLVGLGWQGI